MNYHSRYGTFYYSEADMIQAVIDEHGGTEEEIRDMYTLVDVEATDHDTYIIDGVEMDWDGVRDNYYGAVICDPQGVIKQIAVNN